ncbi:hypothetical protein Mapa_005630 [Marchantia paleacea]|nr:hypothetical protein Mapa_005630 [Marchantia paleacea]
MNCNGKLTSDGKQCHRYMKCTCNHNHTMSENHVSIKSDKGFQFLSSYTKAKKCACSYGRKR